MDWAGSLNDFAGCVAPCLTRGYHRTQLLNTLRLISHTASIPLAIAQPLLGAPAAPLSSFRAAFANAFKEELALNARFDTFSANLQVAYAGQ